MPANFNEFLEIAVNWLTNDGVGLLKNVAIFLLIMVVGFIAAKLARRMVAAALDRSHLQPSPLFKQFAVNVASKATFLIIFVFALGNLGIDTSALIAGLGVSGLVLGFALKDTLSNFASGMLLLLYQPFDVGHFVEIDGMTGTVQDLTLVSTILTTPDNKVISLPNSAVWGNAIINFSGSDRRRIDLVVGVAYDTDIDRARRIFSEILDENETVMDDPEPIVMMADLADSSVNFHVRGWVPTDDYFPVRSELLRQIKYRLDEAEIGIPFPQRELWMHQVPSPAAEIDPDSVVVEPAEELREKETPVAEEA